MSKEVLNSAQSQSIITLEVHFFYYFLIQIFKSTNNAE